MIATPCAAPSLPDRCDVLVVGAGPAGSACAQVLAQQGLSVLLVDQHAFPRDKVCGDGLIPDAHTAFQRLGVLEEVMAAAYRASHVGCIAPRGGRVDVPGRLAVLPRKELDDILCRSAIRAGARFAAPVRFDAPVTDATGRVCGARLKAGGSLHTVAARWVVLATGAVPQAMIAAGLNERRTPSGIALRGYVRNPSMVGRITALEVVWHKRLSRGYGWIFPAPDGVFNIGVGLAHSHSKGHDGRATMAEVNLREMFDTFCDLYPPARELVASGERLGDLKGAPLRCSLDGAALSRPGLLATGEAVGSTYAFTGEGIGKAMETGMLAAEAILPSLRAGRAAEAAGAAAEPDVQASVTASADAAVRAAYDTAVAALRPRFALYERANRVNNHPWMADLLIWRGRKSARILNRMKAVLEETGNPGNLVSLRGIVRLFVPIA